MQTVLTKRRLRTRQVLGICLIALSIIGAANIGLSQQGGTIDLPADSARRVEPQMQNYYDSLRQSSSAAAKLDFEDPRNSWPGHEGARVAEAQSEPRSDATFYNVSNNQQITPPPNIANLAPGTEMLSSSFNAFQDAAAKPAQEDPLKLSAKWNHGLELQSANKDFRVHVGGRYQLDTSWFSAAQAVNDNINIPYADGADFRRARFRVDGTLYKSFEWAAEFDFINSVRVRNQPISATNPGFFDQPIPAITDLWVQINDTRLGNIRIGQQKEAIGLEHLTSSRFLPFMERSYNQDTFYGGTFNGFNPGIQVTKILGEEQMGLIQYGLFKPVNNIAGFNTGDGDYSVVGRMTRLLNYSDEGRNLTHVGFSARQATAVSQAGVPGRIQTFRTRDALRAGVSAGWPVPAGIALFGEDMQWLNAEFIMVRGPWTLQSEYLASFYHDARTTFAGASPGTVTYHGGYIQLFRFLTDDYDRYNKKTGVFERALPKNVYTVRRDDCDCEQRGMGAWQVGARYNYLDLNDETLNGGILHNMTAGLNWFLNPNCKFQWNYIATYRDVADVPAFAAGSGWIHGFGMRMAFDF